MRFSRLARLCAVLIPLLSGASSAYAAKRTLAIADLMDLKLASVERLSMTGHDLLGAYRPPVGAPMVSRIEAGAIHPLAPGVAGAISPDGRWLLYLNEAIWTLRDLHTGAERRYTLSQSPWPPLSAPAWSPDSRYVAAHYDLGALAPPPAGSVTLRHGVKVEGIDGNAAPDRASSLFHSHLLIWDVGRAEPQVIASAATQAFSGSWGGRGDAAVYYYAEGRHPHGSQAPFTAIEAIAPGRGQRREVYRLAAYDQTLHPAVSPDGRFLAFAADADAKAFGVADNVGLLDLRRATSVMLTHDLAVSGVQWGEDGWIYFLKRDGAFQQLERVDRTGHVQALTQDTCYRSSAVVSADGAIIAYTSADGYGGKSVRRWRVREGREEVVAAIARPGDSFTLGAFEQIQWTTPDGLSLKGLLIRPPGYDARQRYPLFVDVHGGGPGSRLYLWSLLGYLAQTPLEWHLWASLGYIVFVPDYRSSGEYGAHVNALRMFGGERDGDVSGIVQDALDVESGVRWMLRRPDVDPSRVAIFGQSAGGARVNYLLTHDHLFTAAIIHDAVASGPEAEDLGDAAQGLPITWYGSMLSEADRKAQLDGFLFDGWRSTTPTLIMVGNPALGGLDPLSAEMLFAMLRSVHVPARMVRFPEDGHEPGSAGGVEVRFEEMKAWLDRYAPPAAGRAAPPAPS